MSGTEKDAWESELVKRLPEGVTDGRRMNIVNLRAKFVSLVACDEQSNRLFTDDDVDSLGKKNGKALDRIFQLGKKLNGLDKDELDAMEKNSLTGQLAGSTSDLLAISA